MPRFFERGDPAEREQRTLEAQLKGAVDRRVDNAVRLQTAETRLNEARSNVEALALESDDAKLDAALQVKRAIEDKIAALHGAATRIGEEISKIEAAIDKVVDGRVRRETAQAVITMADRLATAQAAHQAAAFELEEASREAGIICPEAQAVNQFVLSAREQLVPANEMIMDALKRHARGVLAGSAPASLPRPAAAPPVLTVVGPPPEPTMNIFAIRNLKYVNAAGGISKVGKYKRADLPKKLAELALSSGVALPISDKRMRDLEHMASPLQPDETSCEWIGPPGKEAPPVFMRPGGSPVTHSAFEPHPNVREPFTVMVPRGPEPVAVGQRSEGDEQ